LPHGLLLLLRLYAQEPALRRLPELILRTPGTEQKPQRQAGAEDFCVRPGLVENWRAAT
jgi:hypothetical protein